MTREVLPQRRHSESFDFMCQGLRYTATLGYYPDGRMGEVFLSAAKVGTAVDIHMRDSAVAMSLALQHGCPVERFSTAFLRDARGIPEGPLGTLLDILTKPREAR